MKPKFVNCEISLIYFFLLIPWPQYSVIKNFCSKDSSRLVRKVIRSKWIPILDKYQVKLPSECPLHPSRDFFSPRQDAKKRDRPTQWTCRLCGKSFFQESLLDLHFEKRHNSTVNKVEDAVCLSDFCDIMRCEVFQTEESSSLQNGEQYMVTDIEVWGDSLGQSSAIAKANSAYLSILPLRTSSASQSAKVQSQYVNMCQEKNSQNNIKNTDNCNLTKGSDVKMKVGNATNMHNIRASCKAEELSKLKLKCEQLVRTCITGLLITMSNVAFKEMEDEMNKAVCWYLSCDRYWEDGPLEPRAFPWGLIVILIFVLSTGICFCYYIIWILFDSDETAINSNHHISQHNQCLKYSPDSPAGPLFSHQHMHELYPEQTQGEHPYSLRHYYGDQIQIDTSSTTHRNGQRTSTPLRRQCQNNLPYQEKYLEPRDSKNKPLVTLINSNSNSNTAIAATSTATLANTIDYKVNSLNDAAAKPINSLQHSLDMHHSYVGASQPSLHASSSTHDIIENEVGQNEHYIYVTYPPDLKKRFFEKFE